ncbi:CbiQ family ECF transporter T component [Nocardioides solisilvae]|uniref:CbiQ family ECF transporter T component n=1 Tax=Nocardioides solisilvae TaxID=1542435 RepID=UPI001EF5CE49|nr:CbiQ family ECF transporter T component [Nocardioides solisilvae]
MRQLPLLDAHRPGTSWLHRLPAGAKLLGMLAAGVVVIVLRGPLTGVGALAVALALVASSGLGLADTLRALRSLLLLGLLVGLYHLLQRSWALAAEQVTDLVALILLATVVTTTTPVDAMLDAIVRALGPLRSLGVRPERVALAFSLVLRSIPLTLAVAAETADAARARGLGRSPRALLTPMVIRTVAHARVTGEALHARGLGDD